MNTAGSDEDVSARENLDGGGDQDGVDASSAPEPTPVQSEDPLLEWKNRVAYLSAEIENMRKRFAREKSDVIRFANEGIVRGFLPVLDNLQLAMQAVKTSEGSTENTVFVGLLKGLEMTVKHFEQTLEQAGALAIKSVGETFDPAIHEALSQSSDVAVKDNVISAELQRGFTLHGRVIRPARVVVNKLVN